MRRIASALAISLMEIACIPATAQETPADTYLALHLTPEFVRESVRTGHGQASMMGLLVPIDSYSGEVIPHPTPDAYSDADIKRVLTALDSLLTEWMAPLDHHRPEQVALIREKFLARRLLNPNDLALGDPQVASWVRARRDFIIEAGGIAAFTCVLKHLRPGLLNGPHLPGGYDSKVVAEVDPPFTHELMSISAILDLPGAPALLPARFDIARLRARERELRQEDERDKYLYLGRNNVFPVAVTVSDVADAWVAGNLRVSSAQMLKNLAVWRQRLDLLADPVRSGYCAKTKLDLASLISSGGDPTRVRMSSGSTPDILTWDYFHIYNAYRRGCDGTRNIGAAKRTLQLWAEGHHDKGKMAMVTHCTLAHWARYGVGGNRDEREAKEWQQRVLREVGSPCYPPSEDMIDPRDPFADLHF